MVVRSDCYLRGCSLCQGLAGSFFPDPQSEVVELKGLAGLVVWASGCYLLITGRMHSVANVISRVTFAFGLIIPRYKVR